MKWLLILFLGGALLLIGFFVVFGLMVWNHERGYPKSILNDDAKGQCLVSKKSFVLIKTSQASIRPEVFDILPKPDGATYIYSDYTPGEFLREDGSEIVDLTNAIDVPVGTRFILRDGFQHRTLNQSQYFYWLEPENLSLDSSYFYRPLAITTKDGETHFYTDEDMSLFPHHGPDHEMFNKACEGKIGDGAARTD